MLSLEDDLLIKDSIKTNKPRLPITSITRLTTYLTCSEFYRHKYINKTPLEPVVSEALIQGKLAHYILEECLDPNTTTQEAIYAFTLVLPSFLEENHVVIQDHELLIEVVTKAAFLLYRASARCKIEDHPIRNRDRSIPKDPIAFPPSEFSIQFQELADFKLDLDTTAARSNNIFQSCSLFWILARSLFWTQYWQRPTWAKRTLAVELGFSTDDLNKVPFSLDSNSSTSINPIFINGYIDWVVETHDNYLAILDHKTSKAKPTPQQVLHHPQLNLYAWMYYQTYGKWPYIIGINHLPSGEHILAQLDKEIALTTVQYLKELHQSSTLGNYVRRHPNDYNSPCIKRDWKTNEITYLCPMLSNCWPIYAETLI